MLLLDGKLVDERAGVDQWVGLLREALDEPRAPFEELGKLLDRQLPR